jgi:hypothetical protein
MQGGLILPVFIFSRSICMTSKPKFFLLLLILLLFLSLSACSSVSTPAPTQPAQEPVAPTGETQDAYPAPQTSLETESYPAPQSQPNPLNFYPESVTIPAPQSDTGVVTGKIMQQGSDQAYLAPALVLGTLVHSTDNPDAPPLVGFSLETDPVGKQDQTGTFFFENITPGEYALVVWTPNSQTLLSKSNGDTILVTVEAGKTVDLGEIFVP